TPAPTSTRGSRAPARRPRCSAGRCRGPPERQVGLNIVATIDFPAEIKALRSTLKTIESVSDPAELQERIEMLSDQAASPDLWDDQDNAQKVTSALSHAQSDLERVKRLASRIDDVETLVELGNEMEDADSLDEA